MGELIPRAEDKEVLPLKEREAQNTKRSISISEGTENTFVLKY